VTHRARSGRCSPLADGGLSRLHHQGTDHLSANETGADPKAAEAKGNKGGRRPAITAANTAAVRAAYLDGRSIASLARCQPLDGTPAIPAQRKARREYENRVNTLPATIVGP
jgi:hypothetical protein